MTYYCKLDLCPQYGGYGVSFPDIKGCYSMGDNKEHAIEMAKEALECSLEGKLDDKMKIPNPVNRSTEGLYPIEVDPSIVKRIQKIKMIEKLKLVTQN